MSCVFSGPPRAGKTTVVKRLKGQDVDTNEITASTGVVDERGVVRIDFIPSSNVVTDQDWVEMEEDDEVQAFLNLTIIPQQAGSDEDLDFANEDSEIPQPPNISPQTETSANTVVPSTAVEAPAQSVEAPAQSVEVPAQSVGVSLPRVKAPLATDEAQSLRVGTPPQTVEARSESNTFTQNGKDFTNTQQESEKSSTTMEELAAKSVLKRAQRQSQQIRAKRRLCKRHFLYLSDTGGQPELRKMIALLTPGPSITFIVFDMCYDFNSFYPVRFCHHTNDKEIEYSSFSIKDTINDIIEHIFCSELYSKVQSSIMFIGTHKDEMLKKYKGETSDIIAGRNKELDLILQQCPHYHPDMVIRSDESNIIFCVDNSTFETEHRCIRLSVLSICESERFQVSVNPEQLLLALTLKGAKETVLSYNKCIEVAEDCGIAEEDVREALCLLHEKLMMIRVYELSKDDTIVVVKPKTLINKVSRLLKYMITRDEQVYSNPTVSYTEIEDIARKGHGESMEANVLIKILVHLLIIAPIPKPENEIVERFNVPAMFPDSTLIGMESTVNTVPSIFSDSTQKAVRAKAEPNQLLFAFKPFRFSVPSTLHAPVLCSLLQDKQWTIHNTGSDIAKTCIVFSEVMVQEYAVRNVTYSLTFYKECVSLCLGQEWNKSNVSSEILQQCVNAEQAVTSALRNSIKLVGYGDHNLSRYCFSCFEQSVTSADIHSDCSVSHIITPHYPENIWFSKLDSVRYNPNHHMHRIVPVGDRSSIDGGSLTDALEVLRFFLAVSYSGRPLYV